MLVFFFHLLYLSTRGYLSLSMHISLPLYAQNLSSPWLFLYFYNRREESPKRTFILLQWREKAYTPLFSVLPQPEAGTSLVNFFFHSFPKRHCFRKPPKMMSFWPPFFFIFIIIILFSFFFFDTWAILGYYS